MSVIGKYQIVEQIGEGAMGVVYRANDPVLNRTVAVKVMSEGLAQDTGLRERFLREAQAAGSLQHPNLVTIYDFGETDGHLYIAMEYIEGADLEFLLNQEKELPLAAKLDLIIDVLNGLSFAHRRGIIHRDIKPANIRIDQEGRARIMDFGVAKLQKSNLTGTGMMMGTPNYMAPEQITGTALTPSADLWSTGAVLYELLTNKKPFGADTLHRVLFRIVSEPPSSITEIRPDLPPALVAVVMKSLNKDPAGRYATATDMANALAAVRAKLGDKRVSVTVSQRGSIDMQLTAEREAAQAATRANRSMTMVGVAAAAGIVLATAGILMAWRRDPPPPTQAAAPQPPTVSITPSLTPVPPPQSIATARQSVEQTTPPAASTPPRQTKGAASKQPTGDTPRPTPTQSTVPAPQPQPPATQTQTQIPPQTQPVQQAPAPAAAPPVVRDSPPPAVTAPAPPPVDHRPAIASIVEAYARSIGTRNVAEVRRVYPAMTPQQQSAWESFFSSVRSIKATLAITALDISGTTASARLSGAYDFVTRTGRNETRPAAFDATFQREGERWVLSSVR